MGGDDPSFRRGLLSIVNTDHKDVTLDAPSLEIVSSPSHSFSFFFFNHFSTHSFFFNLA